MANKTLFKSTKGTILPRTDTRNEAGGTAYAFDAKHALAQYAATGCLNGTFYASDEEQLGKVLEFCEHVEPEFIAQTAVYAREKGYMKDLPALLCAVLTVKSPELLCNIFDRVIDNGRMLRNFVQIIRSGVIGRKSLGSLPKRLVRQWIERRNDEQLFAASVGNDPSLADILKMVHPKPGNPQREALFGYMIGRKHDVNALPSIVRKYEDFKRIAAKSGVSQTIPNVPFQLLTSMELNANQWSQIARNASWQTIRMNLNTFARHEVFKTSGWFGKNKIAQEIAARLRSEKEIAKAKVFPYQLLTAYLNTSESTGVPSVVRDALHYAMEIATRNVPKIEGKVYVFPDISGSMHAAVTGSRKGATSKVRCIDIAALVAASMVRKNPDTEIVAFESKAVPVSLNPRDSIMLNASKLMRLPSGGTNCSAPLKYLNEKKAVGDLLIYVSDNESWIDSPCYGRYNGAPATETMRQWNDFKSRSPHAKMVCIDVQPYGTTQVKERPDIVNVGGFSDQVFHLIADVAAGAGEGHWVKTIENVKVR